MTTTLLDLRRPDDRHTAGRLSAEPVIWLGTTGRDGRPHQVPVWFAWDDPLVLIFSMPGTRKWHNLRRSPLVSLSLDSAAGGTDIVLAEGQAAQAGAGQPELRSLTAVFGEKYGPMLGEGGFEGWRSTFSEPILVTVTRIVAWTRSEAGLAYRAVP